MSAEQFKKQINLILQIDLVKVLPTNWKNTTFGKTRLNINCGIEHDV